MSAERRTKGRYAPISENLTCIYNLLNIYLIFNSHRNIVDLGCNFVIDFDFFMVYYKIRDNIFEKELTENENMHLR